MTDPEVTTVYLPQPGELGIGAGPVDEDGEFRSVVWFPSTARAEAEEFIAGGDWVLREGVPF